MKRPTILSIVCIWGFLSVLYAFPQVFSPSIKKLGALIPALYGILVACNFIACVGIWYLKRWGVHLYLMAFFAKTLFNMIYTEPGLGFYVNITLSVVFIVLLIKYYPRLNPNL